MKWETLRRHDTESKQREELISTLLKEVRTLEKKGAYGCRASFVCFLTSYSRMRIVVTLTSVSVVAQGRSHAHGGLQDWFARPASLCEAWQP